MTKIWFLVFVWGPAMLGFSLGWLIRHPDDWTGPAVVGPVGLVLTVLTYRWGLRRRAKLAPEDAAFFVAGMVGGAVLGVALLGMLVLNVIG